MKPIYKLGLGLLTLLAFMAGIAFGATQYSATVAATDVNTNTALGSTYPYVLLINDGPSTVYFDPTDGVATTSNAPLKYGESITLPRGGYSAIGLICAAGQTASVRILAIKE